MSGTTLLASWEEKTEQGDGVVWVKLDRGDPHTRAIFEAVVGRFLATPRQAIEDELAKFVDEKVTLVTYGENMIGGGLIVAKEGTILTTSGGYGLLPKGARTKGFRIDPAKVLYIIKGYSTAEASLVVKGVRDHFPELKPLTQERLDEMPSSSDTCGLCVFGSYPMPDGVATDALVLMGEYDKANDIVDTGVVLLRPEDGVSEYGSVYGRQLLGSAMGEVRGYEPITFAEAIALCNLPFDDAFERVLGNCVVA